MSSFYGGKQGRTYNIVLRYDCISLSNLNDFKPASSFTNGVKVGDKFYSGDKYYIALSTASIINNSLITGDNNVYEMKGMVQLFAKGGSYTRVNYGLYVIIDTIFSSGRTSILNGLLYRRGFDYNEQEPLAGDSQDINKRGAPVKDGITLEAYQTKWMNYVQHPGAGAVYVGQICGPLGRSAEVEIVNWDDLLKPLENDSYSLGSTSSVTLPSTFSGEDDNNKEIKVGYVNIKDANGDINGSRISIQIPYTYMKVNSFDTNPYNLPNISLDNHSINHPFQYWWNFTIPGGKQGKDVLSIEVLQGSELTNLTKDYENNNIVNNDLYFTYSLRNYSSSSAGIVESNIKAWPYRVINTITPYNTTSRPVKNLSIGTNIKVGDLYRQNSDENNLYWICTSAGSITSAGINLPVLSASSVGIEYKANAAGLPIWKAIRLSSTSYMTGLQVDYKAGPSTVIPVPTIDHFVKDSTGKLSVIYNGVNTPLYITTLKDIKSISLPSSITADNQKLTVTYDNGLFQNIGEINTIKAVRRLGDSLLILYSNKEVRDNIPLNLRFNNFINSSTYWKDSLTNIEYNANDLIWHNLGPIGSQYHVQGLYNLEDLDYSPSSTGILKDGFDKAEDPNLHDKSGWLISVIEDKEIEQNGSTVTIQIPHVLAFDYNAYKKDCNLNGVHTGSITHSHSIPSWSPSSTIPSYWYEIMSLTEQSINPARFVTISSSDLDSLNPPLSDNGFCFILSEGNHTHN